MGEDMTACWLLIAGESCWRCGVANVVILGVEVAGFGVVEAGEELCEVLAGAEWETLRERLGVGVLRPRCSKTVDCSYWSQGCAGCDALFGQWPLREALQEAATRGWDGVRRVGPSVPTGRHRCLVGDRLKAPGAGRPAGDPAGLPISDSSG